MAVVLSDSQVADLATGTLNRLGRMRFQQIAQELQDYEVMGKMMKKDKVTFEDGIGIQRTIMVGLSNSAKQTGLFAEDNVNVADVLKTMSIPWRHTTGNYAWERRELLMNRGFSRIVDLFKVRRCDAMISMAEHMEDQGWAKPVDSTDTQHIFGIPYWVTKDPTTAAGFNGVDPTGFSAGRGGLSSTTYPKWANYTAGYSVVTKDDLIDKMRTGYRKIHFKSPVDIPDFRRGNGQRYRIYMNEATLNKFERSGEAQNENLGKDVAPFDDQIAFRRNALKWVPKLDADATNPVYMLDMGTFYPVVLSGDYMRESSPRLAAHHHNTWCVFIDLTWNFLCVDLRRQAVFSI